MGAYIFIMLFGFALIALGIWWAVRRKSCRTEIFGTFAGHRTVSVKLTAKFTPVFRYMFKSEEYEQQAFESLSKRKAEKFVCEEKYRLYINENNPRIVVISRKIQFSECLLMGIGTGFIAAACFGILFG